MLNLKWFLILFFGSAHLLCLHAQQSTSSRYTQPFEALLSKYDMSGTILIYDIQQDSFYSNDFERAAQAYLPASTFKIPNTLIALETGVVKDENTILRWDGTKRAMIEWEKDLTLRDAFQLSCVPCYQEIAGKIGMPHMTTYLDRFLYPKMDINPENLQHFWLVGNSKISALQQVQFLRHFFERSIPISDHTYQTMLHIFEIERGTNYTWSGKTGLSTANGINGWFVGYLQHESSMYYFAANMTPNDASKLADFIPARRHIVREALQAVQPF